MKNAHVLGQKGALYWLFSKINFVNATKPIRIYLVINGTRLLSVLSTPNLERTYRYAHAKCTTRQKVFTYEYNTFMDNGGLENNLCTTPSDVKKKIKYLF